VTTPLRVGLLFGGRSVEHEVSVISARGIATAFDPARVLCVPIAVTGEGRWLPPELSRPILEGSAARVETPEGDSRRVLVDPGAAGLLETGPDGTVRPLPLDALFPIVHGWGGEDGRLQGVLDLAGITCVGAGVLGSAAGMDKEIAKRVFEAERLPVGPWRSLLQVAFEEDPGACCSRLAAALGFPLFVKPANGGSSVGITKVVHEVDLAGALREAFRYDRKVVVEKGIDAREIECAVLGNDRPEASVCGEIVPSREFYDYAAKYLDGRSELRIPAPLTPETAASVRGLALRAYRALDVQGMARVDFLVERGTERVFLNEVNTLPGFTPISMYPKLWEASGLRYRDLLTRLVELALERAEEDRRRTSRLSG
jgi:D-alanine-D-alanine ligase